MIDFHQPLFSLLICTYLIVIAQIYTTFPLFIDTVLSYETSTQFPETYVAAIY